MHLKFRYGVGLHIGRTVLEVKVKYYYKTSAACMGQGIGTTMTNSMRNIRFRFK